MPHMATLVSCLTFRCGVINVACQSGWLIAWAGAGCGVPQLGHFAKRLNQQLREHKSNSRVEPGQAGGPGWSRVQCAEDEAGTKRDWRAMVLLMMVLLLLLVPPLLLLLLLLRLDAAPIADDDLKCCLEWYTGSSFVADSDTDTNCCHSSNASDGQSSSSSSSSSSNTFSCPLIGFRCQ